MTHSVDSQSNTSPVVTSAHVLATRRTVLAAGAVAAAGVGASKLGVLAQEGATPGTGTDSTSVNACVLTPELTEGPYFLDGDLIRQDITDGRPGAPLRLKILVNNATTCQPLTNAAVDIWHCDAHGYYSGVEGNNPGPDADPALMEEAADLRFLRGIQLTDETGVAEFETIYPGWYLSRTIHIHMKVVEDGEAGKTYDGGQTIHTGQLFFDDAITDQVLQLEPYAGRQDDLRTTNEEDNILGDHDDEPGFFLDVQPVSDDWLTDGFTGTISISVDPQNVSAEGMGGGQGGPGGGGEGPGGPPPDGGQDGPGGPPAD
ncbi:MAG: intradiol ring-cleavage dioxygenase [Thermomicrobiales bacterium]|nr:intradiol ring-cleavage dioxygenase [Thermomicrobiales bacterium]MCO5220749.1 intradiol ring-cleavage dioxygenase [Thermomicrobiales bacterium]